MDLYATVIPEKLVQATQRVALWLYQHSVMLSTGQGVWRDSKTTRSSSVLIVSDRYVQVVYRPAQVDTVYYVVRCLW